MSAPRVLIACEMSGTVRDVFLYHGFDAMSCDTQDSETPGPHYKGDVRDVLGWGWDLMIAHPPCTFLANSGVQWLYEEKGRWARMERSARFFRLLLNAPVPRVCVENPVPHRFARDRIGDYSQIIHPWQYGHSETKQTCLWLRNLPLLRPTRVVGKGKGRIHGIGPGVDRRIERSRFYPGIADAMATQWGPLLRDAA